MKVQIGNHLFRLPRFRIGYLGYFAVGDLVKISAVEPLETIRDWIPEEYARNLAKSLIAPDAPDGSVYLAREVKPELPDEDCTVIDEEMFYKVAFVCSRHFSLLDNPALNTESLGHSIGRNLAAVNSIISAKAS